MEFEPFPKIPRLRRDCTITEKIDGTNAAVVIEIVTDDQRPGGAKYVELGGVTYCIGAQSRTRLLCPGKDTDNFGFAAWVWEKAEALVQLGVGRHFGEWYGAGIQRGYGLDHKRFALFNTARWNTAARPACCDVVPELYAGPFSDEAVQNALDRLSVYGSYAVPYSPAAPEGVVVYMHASGTLHKVLLEGDELPKGVRGA